VGRPDFDEVSARLDEILVEAAIQDPKAREFWKKYFLKQVPSPPSHSLVPQLILAVRPQHYVGWNVFVEKFYTALGELMPQDIGGPSGDPEVLNLRCLKALLGALIHFTLQALLNLPFLHAFAIAAPNKDDTVDIQNFGDMVAWFGGMRTVNHTSILDRMRLLLENKCEFSPHVHFSRTWCSSPLAAGSTEMFRPPRQHSVC